MMYTEATPHVRDVVQELEADAEMTLSQKDYGSMGGKLSGHLGENKYIVPRRCPKLKLFRGDSLTP